MSITLYTTESDEMEMIEQYKEQLEVGQEYKYIEFCDWWNDMDSCFRADAEDELDIELDENIIALANLGLWNGRQYGYKDLGNNIKEILTSFNGWLE